MNLSDNLSADVQQDRPDFVGVILTEATAPNEVQAALRAMEDRFQTAFDNAAVGMAHVALDGRWLEVNQCLCEILRYDKETLLEKTAQELTHPEDLAETQEGLRRLAAGEITVDIREKRFLRGDGQAVWTLVAASPAKDRVTGLPRYFIYIIRDISPRKEVEQRLSLLARVGSLLTASLDIEQSMQAVANLMVPGFADWSAVDLMDAQGDTQFICVAHVDPQKVAWAYQFRDRFRADRNSSIGVPNVVRTGQSELHPLITDEMLVAAAHSEEHLQTMREIGFHSTLIVPLKARQHILGALTLVHAESKRTYTAADVQFAEELANYAALAIDNARLYDQGRQAEKELRQLNETLERRVEERTAELARSNRDLQDFAYIASHDLQEPLRKIVAFGDRLHDLLGDKLDSPGSDYLMRMQNAAERMKVLITSLLTLSRISTRGLHLAPVDLARIIHEEVLIDLESAIEESGGTIEIGALPQLVADPLQMRQLLQNLIGNALKFHRPSVAPQVRVCSEQDPDSTPDAPRYRLIVQDQGIGFDEKYLPRLFQPFQRLHDPQRYEGTGMGLAICRKIAERHGGSITATASAGGGATFVVTLPAKPLHAETGQTINPGL